VALGLAQALAEGERRVLLIELDLQHPTVDAALGLPAPGVGLRRYLRDPRVSLVTVRRPGRRGLWVLSAGPAGPGARDEPSAARLQPLLAAAARVFDYVVLDLPPLLPGGRDARVQELIDGLVLVVRARHTTRDALRRAAPLLRPDRICGYVMNGRRGRRPEPAG
jgi:Mrp family chromosome partitioning ATPase